MFSVPDHIFKAYDIRGLIEGELSEMLAYRLGRAYIDFLKQEGLFDDTKSIVVGYDMRPTSTPFQAALIDGLTQAGASVVKIGMCTTPLFNFACVHFAEHMAGIMVTASHNPAAYNGFKMTLGNGLAVGKNSGMDTIRQLVQTGEYEPLEATGTVTERVIHDAYYEKLFSLVPKDTIKPLKLVVDAGNGMAKVTVEQLLAQLPVTVEYLYLDPDGTFPNHEANPLKTDTLKDLQAKVRETGADFGFAYDGDADRVGLVDEQGNVVPASYVGALIGLEVIKQHPGSLFLRDVRASQAVAEVWEEAGAKTDFSPVGHALIKAQMKEVGAVFASELSLHLYYADMYNLDVADLSLLYVLQALSITDNPLSALITPFERYVHSGEINFEVEDKAAALKRIADVIGTEATAENHLDGLRYECDWGWVSVRQSNTEPVLRLNLETATEEETKKQIARLSDLIQG